MTCPLCSKEVVPKQIMEALDKEEKPKKSGRPKHELRSRDDFSPPDFVVIGALRGDSKCCDADDLVSVLRLFYDQNEVAKVYELGKPINIQYRR